MGNEVSKEEKKEKNILRSPNVGQASDLYWASRAGDIDAVRQILATTSFSDLNHLEPNGSTALHAASFFGHVDVVRLLLQERGVMRHRKNHHGLTAYEEAANDEIRQLFHRPNSNRFCNDSSDDNENIFSFPTDQLRAVDENDDKAPDDWVKGYNGKLDVQETLSLMHVVKLVAQSPLLRSICMRLTRNSDDETEVVTEQSAINDLQGLIDKYVTRDHPEYAKACELLSKYIKTKKSEHLLRLYSLETPLYSHLGIGDDNKCLQLPLMFRLGSLKARSFHGRTYRGVSMTTTDLEAYRWALRNKDSIIWTQSFCSTSIDEGVAQGFASSFSREKLSALMIFDFPQPCDIAIQLYALSNTLPCLSDFENEREVLLLPGNIFHVISITKEDLSGQYTIHLENVLPKLDLMALWAAYHEDS